MKFGYFDDEHCEYVIQTAQTPSPWINYFGSEQFFSLFSQAGGGYCFFRDALLRRITHYLIGLRPEHLGLRIAPTIADEIGSFQMNRHLRGAEYQVAVLPAIDGRHPGLNVDGQRLDADVVPYAEAGSRVTVECILPAK